MPIFTGIAAAISGALFAGSAIATSLIAGGLAFAVQLGMSYLNRQKKQKYTAVQGEVQFGADVPAGTGFGLLPVMGQRVYYAKWGKGNKFNADVFALANGWCDGLEPYVYFYGQKYNLIARDIIDNEVAHYWVEGFESHISIRFYDGRPGQGPDTKLVADTANLGKTWKATSVGAGICYVVVERRYDSDKFSKGRPDFKWVLRGLREYDPRKDSTVAGGSGPQRLDNPATWAHTTNPAVHRLNYQLGLRGLLSGRTLIGEGKSLGQIDLATYFLSMNVCDTVRAGKKTYECSLWVDGEMDHTEILKEFDDAMAGYGLNRRGLSGVIPGAPQIPVLTLTANDIPVDRPQEIQRRKSAFDLYNYISGQFTSIESMWEPESLKPVTVNADIAADGRRRQTTNDFLQVTDPDIAQYLLNIRYRQNRKGGSATVPVSRRVGLAVQEGEWISFEGVTWLITEWQCDENFRFTLKLAETGSDIYDDGDIEPGPIVIPPTPPINPSMLSTVQNFNVQGGMITGDGGYDQPALKFTWDPPDDPTITAVRIQYQINGGGEMFQEQSLDPESGEYTTTKNVLSDELYAARATITTVPDRLKTYTPWIFAATKTGIIDLNVGLGQVNQDVLDRFHQLQQELDDNRPLLVQLQEAFQLATSVFEQSRRRLTAEVGSNKAIFDEQIVAIADDLSAAAAQTTTISASVAGLSGEVSSATAQGLVKFGVAANQSGVDARFSVFLRGSINDVYKESGFYLELYTEGGVQKSRFAVLADQFVVTDGSISTLPMVFEGGALKLQIANIGTVTAGILQSPNGKMVINLNAGTIEVFS
ncbi:hypothetical protein AM571_CH01441 [Rhizobium etli 8C-3]|uniref:Tip attachment protein J central straight fiber domain-containing protein n=1 Tax=Rhizobium etli 8C-3 TaxID=538025 RepID=A0A1L5P2G0_RHIET|nr:phage tail protein [Rhizobium etli]APO74276.1 hypothetical protein AM571_CH01441 [Rhizobium etli 8C-3]